MSARSASATSKVSRQHSPSLQADAPFVPDPREIKDEDIDLASGLSPRRQARAIALGVLYELDSVTHPIEDCLAWSLVEGQVPEETCGTALANAPLHTEEGT